MATPWRNCYASVALVDEINKRFTDRDRASDGTIGDAAHATRTSDHNPWVILDEVGIVRARDVDKDGVDAAGLTEYLRQLGADGDNRLYPGGYVIFNRRITTPDFSGWKTYTGSNPHTAHFHVSFSTAAAGFDSTRPWGIWPTTAAVAKSAVRPVPAPLPPQLEDDLMAAIPLRLDAARTFTEAIGAEAGAGSMVASRAWVTFGSTYGGTTWKRVTALSNTGVVLASWSDVRTTNNTNVAQELPAGTRCVTVEGQSDNAGTRPWASVWCVR